MREPIPLARRVHHLRLLLPGLPPGDGEPCRRAIERAVEGKALPADVRRFALRTARALAGVAIYDPEDTWPVPPGKLCPGCGGFEPEVRFGRDRNRPDGKNWITLECTLSRDLLDGEFIRTGDLLPNIGSLVVDPLAHTEGERRQIVEGRRENTIIASEENVRTLFLCGLEVDRFYDTAGELLAAHAAAVKENAIRREARDAEREKESPRA